MSTLPPNESARSESAFRTIEPAQHTAAKIVGFLYLFTMATSIVGFSLRGPLLVRGDAVQTARNIAASQRLYRISIVSDLLTVVGVIVLLWALYVVLNYLHCAAVNPRADMNLRMPRIRLQRHREIQCRVNAVKRRHEGVADGLDLASVVLLQQLPALGEVSFAYFVHLFVTDLVAHRRPFYEISKHDREHYARCQPSARAKL